VNEKWGFIIENILANKELCPVITGELNLEIVASIFEESNFEPQFWHHICDQLITAHWSYLGVVTKTGCLVAARRAQPRCSAWNEIFAVFKKVLTRPLVRTCFNVFTNIGMDRLNPKTCSRDGPSTLDLVLNINLKIVIIITNSFTHVPLPLSLSVTHH
jgi:hypothetical protein